MCQAWVVCKELFSCEVWVVSEAMVVCQAWVVCEELFSCETWVVSEAMVVCQAWVVSEELFSCEVWVVSEAWVAGGAWFVWEARVVCKAWALVDLCISDCPSFACGSCVVRGSGSTDDCLSVADVVLYAVGSQVMHDARFVDAADVKFRQ